MKSLALCSVLLTCIPSAGTKRLSCPARMTEHRSFAAAAPSDALVSADYAWPLEDLNGKKVMLSDLSANVTLVNFWATWCHYCVEELPSLQHLYDQTKNDPSIRIVLVTDEDPATVKQFMAAHHYTLPVYVVRSYQDVPASFAVQAFPTTVILFKKLSLVVRRVGATQWDAPQLIDLLRKQE